MGPRPEFRDQEQDPRDVKSASAGACRVFNFDDFSRFLDTRRVAWGRVTDPQLLERFHAAVLHISCSHWFHGSHFPK
eukprot:5907784-Prymnesium_polylepis.1